MQKNHVFKICLVSLICLTFCSIEASEQQWYKAERALLHEQINFNGEEIYFSKPVLVGRFAGGHPYVITDRNFGVRFQTASKSIKVNGKNRIVHGAMWDPTWKGEIAHDSWLSGVKLNMKLNVDPGAGSFIEIKKGRTGCLVKAISDTSKPVGARLNDKAWGLIKKYVPLFFVKDEPKLNSFHPFIGDPEAVPTHNADDIKQDVLRVDVVLPKGFKGWKEAVARVPVVPMTWWGGDENVARGLRSSDEANYSAEYSEHRTTRAIHLHTNLPREKKLPILIHEIQMGLQYAGQLERGYSTTAGAGQGLGKLVCVWIAGFALQDPALLNKARVTSRGGGAALKQPLWVKEDLVGFPVKSAGFQGTPFQRHQTYFPEMIGMADWVSDPGNYMPSNMSSDISSEYRDIASCKAICEMAVIYALKNSPNGRDGFEELLNGKGLNDLSQKEGAPLAYYDRLSAMKLDWNYNRIKDEWLEVFNTIRDTVKTPRWEGVPSQPGTPKLKGGVASFTYKLSPYGGSHPVKTRSDLSYSLDQVQFVVVKDVQSSGRIDHLLGGKHYVRHRDVNAKGEGPWSGNAPRVMKSNKPYVIGNVERGVVNIKDATGAQKPVCVVQPEVFYKIGSWWGPGPYQNATDGAPSISFIAGSGYWKAIPAPSLSYQWIVDGNRVAGATKKTFNIVPFAGKSISCEVTATNSSGYTSVITTPFKAPVGKVDPKTVLMDTDFGKMFPLNYPYANKNKAGNKSARPKLRPLHSRNDASSLGALIMAKTGSWPSVYLPITSEDVSKKTY